MSSSTPHRLDVLGPTSRGPLFWESDLRNEPDPALQFLVAEVAGELGMPIALVSLVTDRSQVFRAQVGLPGDLASAGATDRDVSFCQVVVRDASPLVVEEALGDPRVPQDLVHRYGIRSYLGAPLVVDGAVLGTLCVLDVNTRQFGAEDLANLQSVRDRVQERLLALRRPGGVAGERLSRAAAPTFAELRNVLTALSCSVSGARMAQAELSPLLRTVERLLHAPDPPVVLGALRGSVSARDDLDLCIQELADGLPRVVDAILALQRATVRGSTGECSLRGVLADATAMALHHTRLLGPVVVAQPVPDVQLGADHSDAVAALASVLSTVSDAAVDSGADEPIRLDHHVSAGRVTVTVLSGASLSHLQRDLAPLLGESAGLGISVTSERGAVVSFPSRAQAPVSAGRPAV